MIKRLPGRKAREREARRAPPRRCCCVCMSERVQADTPPLRPVPPLPSDRASTPGRGREERGGGGSRRECQCSARLLSRTHCGEVGEGGRCVPFSPVPFLTLTGRGQSPAEGNKGKGGGKPTPAAPESPWGRQSPAAPADSSAAADRAPGSAAVFLLSSSTSSSSPSLKGESSVRRKERNLGRCVGCPAIGSVLAIKMKSKKGSCDGVPGQSGVPRAPTRGGKGKGGLSLSQPESLCLLGLLSPVPPVHPLACIPWKIVVDAPLPDKTCGAVVWRRPPLCAAGSLSKTCPAVRLVSPANFCSLPLRRASSPCSPVKHFFTLFPTEPHCPREGDEGAGAFPNLGRGKRSRPANSLFAGTAAWGGIGGRASDPSAPSTTLFC